ncbi:hypothetical protein AM587_10007302 [Phytophthora nicotianae]|uniref:Uncharacterized protein n=1 Tax=Phytophthora nicotianae TaxID=4792 RepID=A0A0W8CYQ2_PHYNI|nr:hypothetical protein AM587_10007302 [Phytophthora nicotianae]
MAAPAPSSKWTVAAPLDSRKRTIRPPTSDSYGDWTLDQLKLECTARKLNVVKNTRKQDRVDLLKAWDSNKEAVQALVVRQRKRSKGVSEEEERRSAGCMFRLINVLFSDRFFDSFLTSGNLLPRDVLDDGGSTFWFDVANAFASDTTEYDTLISGDAVFEDIDTSSHMAHSAAKLKRMWKEVSSHFARAEAGSKVSGQGSADFWDFCDGRADVYYLDRWCEHRQAGREFCSAKLYPEDEDDSTQEGNKRQPTSHNHKRQKRDQTAVFNALLDKIDTLVGSDVDKAQEDTWLFSTNLTTTKIN